MTRLLYSHSLSITLYLLGWLGVLSLYSCNEEVVSSNENSKVGLNLLPPIKTGIDFNNQMIESKQLNHLYYSQIYNGAGVGIGDINNDGKPDIFFCGNQVPDKLYLNKGKFEFEDITHSSNMNQKSGWSWGVAMADVNTDGWLDIYVSRNGVSMQDLSKRQNMLFINNQDLSFTESAKEYGLADIGFSSQAVFFDMDNDGDLDMYQVNQPPDPRLFYRYKIPKERQKYHTDKLYINENGIYVDVSKESGIAGLAHGLSVNASDFNNDGWTDLYICNDYDEPDYMYYNMGDGTFKNVIDQKLKHISRFSMGSDAGDINNDGFMDLITLDMAAEDHYRSKTNMGSMSHKGFYHLVDNGKHYQYMFNTLQINTGMGTFTDIAQLAGVSKTDWSWGSLMVDIDNDGWKDLMVTNGIKRDIRNNDFLNTVQKELNNGKTNYLSLSTQAPTAPLSNYIYKNMGGYLFQDISDNWNFNTKGYSSGIAYGDLDNDGDKDIVVNNMDAPAFIYENTISNNFLKIDFKGPESNPMGIGAKVTINCDNQEQTQEHFLTRGYFSSMNPGLIFGLNINNHVDEINIIWPGGKKNYYRNIQANTTIVADYSQAVQHENETIKWNTLFTQISAQENGVSFVHHENDYNDYAREILLPHKLSQNGPFVTTGDVNDDGLTDLFIGGASGQSGILYIQGKNDQFIESNYQPWQEHKQSEDMECLFVDVDNDKDLDLLIASGGAEFERGTRLYQDRVYVNDGAGRFNYNPSAMPKINESTECIISIDVDSDGDLDLFVGTRVIPGHYGHPASSYLLRNNNGTYEDQTTAMAQDLKNIGMVTDAVATDFDQDGDSDLIIVGEWMSVTLLENVNGSFVNSTEEYGLSDLNGIWWSITAGDLDNDGDDDYILGNLGKNNRFKVFESHPFKLYVSDFDHNGTNDVVMSNFYKNDYVPLRGLECTSQQMPYVAKKFKTYTDYASSNIKEILPETDMGQIHSFDISNFESIILINEGTHFSSKLLPIQAQFSPLKDVKIMDVNKDGLMDVVGIGNHYGVEVETIRYDAGVGFVLLGDGQNNFKYIPPTESGFFADQDSRKLEYLKLQNKEILIVTNNDSTLSMFSL